MTLGTEPKTYQLKQIHLIVSEPVAPLEIGQIPDNTFKCSMDIAKAFVCLQNFEQEYMITLHLDAKNRIKALQVVTVGTLTRSLCHPREILRAAIVNGAVGLIMIHNHPSGEPEPSTEDITITGRIKEGAKLIGITLLDHIIIGSGEGYFSFADEGII